VLVTLERKTPMRIAMVSLLVPLALGGCLSFSSSNPPPPANNTVIVPQGSTAVCSNGGTPPCR
jgi:hypothetical protein